jgi:hypothetical protein
MTNPKLTTRQRFKIKRFFGKNNLAKTIMPEITKLIADEDVESFFNKLTDDLGVNAETTFALIYNLQEGFCRDGKHQEDRLIPDHYELCENCKSLFDTDSSGVYIESGGWGLDSIGDLDSIGEYYEIDFSDGQYPEGHFCNDDCFLEKLYGG